MSWTGWLKQGAKWHRATTGETVDQVHARLLAEARRRGLPLTTGSRLITRGERPQVYHGGVQPSRPEESQA